MLKDIQSHFNSTWSNYKIIGDFNPTAQFWYFNSTWSNYKGRSSEEEGA